MTGGAFTPDGRQFLQTVQRPVLEKPFDVPGLRAMVTGQVGGLGDPGTAAEGSGQTPDPTS